MMKFFAVEPEIAGGLGAETVIDTSVHPPEVRRLHYELDGWLGDALIESFPCFVVTGSAKDRLVGMSGVAFAEVKITTSAEFDELRPDVKLPMFAWLQPIGRAGEDDFGIAPDHRLVVSEPVIVALQGCQFSNAQIEPWSESSR